MGDDDQVLDLPEVEEEVDEEDDDDDDEEADTIVPSADEEDTY
jgi:hypothetical protein